MGLIFKKERQIEIFGRNGFVFITETDEFDKESMVILSLRQFEELANRHQHIVKEASEEKD
jgi:exosome complex RNA-binding protein Rrp4